ncbi:MAG TPA: MazG family protein [Jatrophihabitantaceae bacterium]|jgi:XTP/dITP diphosphohydrolase|nr:MazG family protein [Jatrophihabitantaceae bacterium]
MTASDSALLRAVAVMDRLRSPGGCPWDAEQTHASLARYLLEETYEVLEAIETGDAALLREELGDLLLQVLFHARLAQELPEAERFSISDVAADLVDKLVRRHPHVFASAPAEAGRIDVADGAPTHTATADIDADQVNENWERLKAAEKGRVSIVDGVPVAQPALALAGKLVARAARVGLSIPLPAGPVAGAVEGPATDQASGPEIAAEARVGAQLLAVVHEAVAAGIEPETALRRAVRGYRAAIVTAERERSTSA